MRGLGKLIIIALWLISILGCEDFADSESAESTEKETLAEGEAPRRSKKLETGDIIDQYKGVPVFFNGETYKSSGRHISPGGYNYGMKWQCVEFIKRFYYDNLKHEMPYTYGNAKDFFLKELNDGDFNTQRGLFQFLNGGGFRPQADDILVFAGDEYGHVAIITEVGENYISIIQQNVGTATRHKIPFTEHDNSFYIMNKTVIGYLGKRDY